MANNQSTDEMEWHGHREHSEEVVFFCRKLAGLLDEPDIKDVEMWWSSVIRTRRDLLEALR